MNSKFEDLKGKILTRIEKIKGDDNDIIALHFYCSDGTKYLMNHEQCCCEYVFVKDIVGDLNRILNQELLLAEEVIKENDGEQLSEYDESYTWTFYKLATVNDSVTISWYGSSNGYYSESVSFHEF